MKEWKNPEMWNLGAEQTASGYTGNNSDGAFIDISAITGHKGDHALLTES